jgi:hypothetical protein
MPRRAERGGGDNTPGQAHRSFRTSYARVSRLAGASARNLAGADDFRRDYVTRTIRRGRGWTGDQSTEVNLSRVRPDANVEPQ